MTQRSLSALNEAPSSEFVAATGGVFEHAPWVSAAAAGRRPFGSLGELFACMRQVVLDADEERRLELLRGHPELAGAAAKSGNMTVESVSEQGGSGLDLLSAQRAAAFDELNGAYRERFGFPFIICVRRHGRDSVLREFRRRLGLSPAEERETALAEVFRIAALRLDCAVEAHDGLPVHGRLSTHVLDTANGMPGAGISLSLVEMGEDGEREVVTAVTNAGGRTDAPLIGDRPLPCATYELRFEIGAYYRTLGVPLAEVPFLDVVPVRFGISDPEGHYHVPLTATPWSYSTYRGS